MDGLRRPRSRKSIAYLPSPDDIGFDKENNRTNATTTLNIQHASQRLSQSTRKARSKSLGPEVIEVLQSEAGNRQRLPTAGGPKSILKPSIPLSPLRSIPARKNGKEPKPSQSPRRSPGQISRSQQSPNLSQPSASDVTDINLLDLKFQSPTKPGKVVASNAEQPDEQSMEAVQDGKGVAGEELLMQRELRRKSLANRRVSFAPEATLHTWDMIEEMQDLTTSSASTNSTRTISGVHHNPRSMSPPKRTFPATTNTPSPTPCTQFGLIDYAVPESLVTPSGSQHETQHHEGFGTPRPGGVNVNRASPSSSSCRDSNIILSANSSPGKFLAVTKDISVNNAGAGASLDDAVHVKEPFKISTTSFVGSGASVDDVDDVEDVSMDLTGVGIPAGIQPWARKPSSLDLEDFNPFSPAFRSGTQRTRHGSATPMQDIGDTSMDMTNAFGSIINVASIDQQTLVNTFARPSPKRKSQNQRRSSGASSFAGDSTMEFTTALGRIQAGCNVSGHIAQADEDEELSMELTSVFRSENEKNDDLHKKNESAFTNEEYSVGVFDKVKHSQGDGGMEMTGPQVSKKPDALPNFVSEDEEEVVMDITKDIGAILDVAELPGPRRDVDLLVTSDHMRGTNLSPVPATSRAFHHDSAVNDIQQDSITRHSHMHEIRLEKVPGSRKLTIGSQQYHVFDMVTDSSKDTWEGQENQTAILDRRISVIENPVTCAPRSPIHDQIRVDEQVMLGRQTTSERTQEQERESSQFMLRNEPDCTDVAGDITTTLKEAIMSMTPKKRKLGGRKSLATGSAKGLLGSRPIELDDFGEDEMLNDADEDRSSSTKRRKLFQSHQASQTVADSSRTYGPYPQISADLWPSTPKMRTPAKAHFDTTPKSQRILRNGEADGKAQQQSSPSSGKSPSRNEAVDAVDAATRLSLSDFLELVNIRFIEIDTTKRRHTMISSTATRRIMESAHSQRAESFKEDYAVSAVCTAPLLELYQHSCRELRKYISEGRNVIREIELETHNYNPPLFKEYRSASPLSRSVMDNRFRNMKAHARLVSKGLWYEWRMKLLDGLKDGLNGNAQGLCSDQEVLGRQERMVVKLSLQMESQKSILEATCARLQASADKFASYNQLEVVAARWDFVKSEENLEHKTRMSDDYKRKLLDMDAAIQEAEFEKIECLQLISEAEALKERHRGWSDGEVAALEATIETLEAKHHWTITTASAGSLTMTYRGQLQLFFNLASFKPVVLALPASKQDNTPISLSYIGDTAEYRPQPLSTEKRFFLQLMRAYLQCLVQYGTHVQDLLRFVSDGWDRALAVAGEVNGLRTVFSTACSILDDEHLAIRATMLLPALETKIHIVFSIGALGCGTEVEVGLSVSAEVIYGEKYKEDRMREFVMSKIGLGLAEHAGGWVSAAQELRRKLIMQGKKK